MDILQTLCSIATAPFGESRVIGFVKSFARERPGLVVEEDSAGNLLIRIGSQIKSKLPRMIFAAHLDHPGFMARRMLTGDTLEADFLGGVRAGFLPGSKVFFFDGEGEIRARVISATAEKGSEFAASAVLKVGRGVSRGTPGAFDLGVGKYEGGKFYCRVCDDLAGAAGALAMMDELMKKAPIAPTCVLLTRAEEEGFIGAMAAVKWPKLLRKTDRIIAIETSAVQVAAPQGEGPIIRVGDKSSIFNSALTYFLTEQAQAIQKKDKKFKYQRALMPGGTCEATVYDLYGYTAASICVALANYHNMDKAAGKLAAEFIDVRDWKGMVRLFVRVARQGHRFDPGNGGLRVKLEKRFKKFAGRLG